MNRYIVVTSHRTFRVSGLTIEEARFAAWEKLGPGEFIIHWQRG